jgi:periplasmic divalent cation tolerance protein
MSLKSNKLLMIDANFVELVLTCGSWQEAQRIADALFEQRLIACAEFIEIKSKYLWHSEVEEAKEIKLIMESIADNFKKVEAEVAKLHSYDTFVLQQIPLTNLSNKAQAWWTDTVSKAN